MAKESKASTNPYDLLGVEKSASDADIRKAYFKLVRLHSPEKEPLKFKQIREAYDLLSTPEKRVATDMCQIQIYNLVVGQPQGNMPKNDTGAKIKKPTRKSASQIVQQKKPSDIWIGDVLKAAKSLSDLDRRHFREDFREVVL